MQILKDAIKEKIMNSAISQITDKGYKKTSMVDIARGAEISVGNVYRYFKNKETLVGHILDPIEKEINHFLTELPLNHVKEGDTQLIEDIIGQFVVMCERYKARFNIFFNYSNNNTSNHFRDRLLEILITRINEWIPPLEDTEEERILRKAIACSWIEGVGKIVNEYFDQPDKLKKILNNYCIIMLNGLNDRL